MTLKTPRFESNKIKRMIDIQGLEYKFIRKALDEFGGGSSYEKDDNGIIIERVIKGIHHEVNGYVTITTGDSARTRSKKTPMILCMYEGANSLKTNDEVIINSKVHKLTGLVNISDWNIIGDISLEVIDNGVS